MDYLVIRKEVIDTLQKNTKARDNDFTLIYEVYRREIRKYKFGGLKRLYSLFRRGKVSPPETITRTRRALQERYAELRGKDYEKRKKREQEVINQLKLFK